MGTSRQEPSNPASADELRRKAGQRLGSKTTKPVEEITESDVRALADDSQVRQVELKRQNEELLRTQSTARELRESAERYRAMVEGADVGIAFIDTSYNVVTANTKSAQLCGKSPREMIGQKCFRAFRGRKKACDDCAGFQALAAAKPAEIESILRKEDGSTVFLRIKASPLLDRNGEPTGFIEIVEDISERKRAEESLERAREAAEAANRAKSEFLANMSHEIRTPMTAILGFTELLMSPNLARDEQAEFLEGIRRNGKALLGLIGDILDLSRLEADKLTLEKVDCPLQPIIDDVVSIATAQSKEKGLGLKIDCESSLPETIRTDPARLRQILANLIGNAVKFTEQGEIHIAIRCLREAGRAARMEFVVSDTGIGIPAEKMDDIFRPFTQADASPSRRYGGTGLGLAVSQRLAKALDGSIVVAGELGKGSTFTLTIDAGPPEDARKLPTSQTATDAVQRMPGQEEPALGGRLLLVEDEPDIQRIIGLLLRKTNLEVHVAGSGQAACEMAQMSKAGGRPYDLILMDIQMPGMNGYETARWLRQHGWHGPIVALTAHALAGDRERCLAAGCDDYIAKPGIAAGLRELLARHLLPANRAAETFVEELSKRVETIEAALNERDFRGLAEAARQLEANAAAGGFSQIAAAADALRGRVAEERDLEQVRAAVAELTQLAEQLRSRQRSRCATP